MERFQLGRAIKDYEWENCDHLEGHSHSTFCKSCVIDFIRNNYVAANREGLE